MLWCFIVAPVRQEILCYRWKKSTKALSQKCAKVLVLLRHWRSGSLSSTPPLGLYGSAQNEWGHLANSQLARHSYPLKGVWHEIFKLRFFSWIIVPQAHKYSIGAVLNFFEILLRYSRKIVYRRWFISDVNNTGEKFIAGVVDTGDKFFIVDTGQK